MSTTFKIRLLLFLLTISFAVTAITINFTFNKNEVLDFDAKTIETALHKKEQFVKNYLNGPSFDSLRSIHDSPAKGTRLIAEFRDERNIYLDTYYNHRLTFWGSNRVAPLTDAGLREGSNLINTDNGTYEVIKRSSGSFSALAIIPIKANYKYQNHYLKNVFSPDLIKENNLEIAKITDKNVYNLSTIDGRYLLSVKLKPEITNSFYSKLELWMWLFAVFLGTVFINYLCVSLAGKGQVKAATAVFFVCLLALLILTLENHWIDSYFNVSLL